MPTNICHSHSHSELCTVNNHEQKSGVDTGCIVWADLSIHLRGCRSLWAEDAAAEASDCGISMCGASLKLGGSSGGSTGGCAFGIGTGGGGGIDGSAAIGGSASSSSSKPVGSSGRRLWRRTPLRCRFTRGPSSPMHTWMPSSLSSDGFSSCHKDNRWSWHGKKVRRRVNWI